MFKRRAWKIIIPVILLLLLGVAYLFYDSRQTSEAIIRQVFTDVMPQPYTVSASQGNPHIIFTDSCQYLTATYVAKDKEDARAAYGAILSKLSAANWKITNKDYTIPNKGTVYLSEVSKNSLADPDMRAHVTADQLEDQFTAESVTVRFTRNYKSNCL